MQLPILHAPAAHGRSLHPCTRQVISIDDVHKSAHARIVRKGTQRYVKLRLKALTLSAAHHTSFLARAHTHTHTLSLSLSLSLSLAAYIFRSAFAARWRWRLRHVRHGNQICVRIQKL